VNKLAVHANNESFRPRSTYQVVSAITDVSLSPCISIAAGRERNVGFDAKKESNEVEFDSKKEVSVFIPLSSSPYQWRSSGQRSNAHYLTQETGQGRQYPLGRRICLSTG
jgi:hypothetical protein